MRSWLPGTQKQCDTYIKMWIEFCLKRQINSLQAYVIDVLTLHHDFHGR